MKLSKLLPAIMIAAASVLSAHAQNAREVNVLIDNENKTAFMGDYNVSADVMSLTLSEHMKKAGLPAPGKAQGYTLYKGVVLPEISNNRMDIYTRVDGKKNNATVTILVATGYNNFISSATDGQTSGNIHALLQRLTGEASAKQAYLALLVQITAQKSVVAAAEKKAGKHSKDVSKLQIQKEKLEKKIANAHKDADASAKAAEAEKIKLTELNNKLGN
jgi:valyl-tRNA synthetase